MVTSPLQTFKEILIRPDPTVQELQEALRLDQLVVSQQLAVRRGAPHLQ
jgi:hypothetical protein